MHNSEIRLYKWFLFRGKRNRCKDVGLKGLFSPRPSRSHLFFVRGVQNRYVPRNLKKKTDNWNSSKTQFSFFGGVKKWPFLEKCSLLSEEKFRTAFAIFSLKECHKTLQSNAKHEPVFFSFSRCFCFRKTQNQVLSQLYSAFLESIRGPFLPLLGDPFWLGIA